ncbi:MAG: tetratricopeptide repeat protein [Bacteroidetes bacterium]|nr:MAG: tetratricopeptide repeat protein [Bacteroidota bacterium]
MAKRKSPKSAANTEIEVQEVQAANAPFWETNQNLILYVVGGIALLIMGWWGYKVLVVEPQQEEAVAAIWQAQNQFERDSFQLALENPGGGYDGFLGIIDKYGSSAAGNSAKYYAGVCYLQMGDFDNAIKYLEDFDADGDLMPIMKNGLLGDCYAEKQDYSKALDYYADAADAGNNNSLAAYYQKKLGMLYEYQGNTEAAQKAFQRLYRDFPNASSADWRDVEKYLYKAGAGK